MTSPADEAWHVHPIHDDVTHDFSGKFCRCYPMLRAVLAPNGVVTRTIFHHAFDKRIKENVTIQKLIL